MTPTVRDGDSIRVEWGSGQSLRGKVVHVSGSWVVLRPIRFQRGPKPRGTDRLVVHIEEPRGGATCPASLWRKWKGSDFTLQLQPEESPPQRRSYFRTEIQLSLALSDPSHGTVGYEIFKLEDLSGGGCRCRVDSATEFAPGQEINGFLNLEDGEAPLPVSLIVVRQDQDEVAFRFAPIEEKQRQRVLQTLFREYRAKRASARSDEESRVDA